MHLKAGAVAQWLCLPSMYKALGSTSSTAKKKKGKGKNSSYLPYIFYEISICSIKLGLHLHELYTFNLNNHVYIGKQS
jgi:hypothetical protein